MQLPSDSPIEVFILLCSLLIGGIKKAAIASGFLLIILTTLSGCSSH
jgi:hypothetical protein